MPPSQQNQKLLPLQLRLKVDPEEFAAHALPLQMLRKYIGYARKWVHPKYNFLFQINFQHVLIK